MRLFLLCLVMGISLSNIQCGKAQTTLVKEKEVYDCQYIKDLIRIDGLLDERAWQRAKVMDFFIPETHEKPISKTEAKLLWDEKYLYVGFKAYDKDIWGYYQNRDDTTCWEDVLEIFFKTDLGKEPYYGFEINALNTIYDAFYVRRVGIAGGVHRWSKWDCQGLKSARMVKGTSNNREDEDEYWQLEVAIPFSDLSTLQGRAPEIGNTWLFHLARYDYSVYLPKGVELSSCASLSKVDFHHDEDWLYLRFTKKDEKITSK